MTTHNKRARYPWCITPEDLDKAVQDFADRWCEAPVILLSPASERSLEAQPPHGRPLHWLGAPVHAVYGVPDGSILCIRSCSWDKFVKPFPDGSLGLAEGADARPISPCSIEPDTSPLAKSIDYAEQAQAILDATPDDGADPIARALVYALLANAAALRAKP